MTHRKIHGSKNQYGELSLEDLDQGFKGNEVHALEYLNGKFEAEVENIKIAVQKTLIADGNKYDT